MTTIKDIANYTGVSPTTVSNVIHGRVEKVSVETKNKVERALKELNYTSNMAGRLLAKYGSKIIGVIIQDSDALKEQFYDNPYHGELIQALEYHIREAGYFLMFHRVANFEDGVKLIAMWDLEGVVISGATNSDIKNWQESVTIPIVFLDTYGNSEAQPLLNVGVDDFNGAYNMTVYLIKQGLTKLMFIAKGETPDDWVGVDAMRTAGVKQAVADYHVSLELIAAPPTYRHYQEFILSLTKRLTKDYYGVFFASDLLAVQAISEFYQHQLRIPTDVSVASFDGTPYSIYATPKLTTVYQDVNKKAELAVELMLKALNNQERFSEHLLIDTELIVGESVKKLIK